MQKYAGFTLVEVAIVVVIFLIIAGVSFPLYFKFQEFSERESVKQEALHVMREVQLKAATGYDNQNQGLYFSGHNYTVYSGETFETKIMGSDQNFELSNIISSPTTDINFQKITGTPTNATSLLLRNDRSAETSTISINGLGLIQ